MEAAVNSEKPITCWSGGTGRRTGLKIPRPSLGMWVRPPPPAPIKSIAYRDFFRFALDLFLVGVPKSVPRFSRCASILRAASVKSRSETML